MNERRILNKINKKFNDWIESIKDDEVKSLVERNTIITGGCICSMLQNEEPKDYDVYFKTKETALKVATYYMNLFYAKHPHYEMEVVDGDKVVNLSEDERAKYPEYIGEGRVAILISSSGVAGDLPPEEATEDPIQEPEGANNFEPIFLSPNAITLSDKIQIIIRFYGDVEEIHSNYDFTHTTNSWESDKTGKARLTLRPEALTSILTKELYYQGSKYPVCSIIRTRKFLKRGWYINAGQYLKMILQCGELDLTDINVLQDQLVGVDSAYFGLVIDAVKEANPEKLNSGYLIEIVDRIF